MSAVRCVGAMHNGAAVPVRFPPLKGGTEQKAERVTMPRDDRKDDKKVENLRRWLQQLGHDDCNLRLERWPRASEAPGYGMVASSGGVNKSDVIVRVPKEALMTEEDVSSMKSSYGFHRRARKSRPLALRTESQSLARSRALLDSRKRRKFPEDYNGKPFYFPGIGSPSNTAATCPYIGRIADEAQLTPWQAMCLHLLCERARREKSPWYPYIALLPSELQMAGSHPMLWPQRMRRDWLTGSPMLDTTERRLQICREDHEALLAAGASNLMPGGPGSGGFVTEAAVRWAAVILLSRSFSLDIDNLAHQDSGPSIALVPWADMLNHSSAAGKESCLVYDAHSRTAALRAHQVYEEGDQVYDSYGPNMSPSQLLVDYGFVDKENQNYAVDLPGNVLGPLKSQHNGLLLEAVGLPYEGAVFTLTPSGVDESVLSWSRAALASQNELANAGWKEDTPTSMWLHHGASTAMANFARPISRENEAEVLRRLLWASEDLLKQYPTSIDEDVAALTASDADGCKAVPLPWARTQAVRALISEKRALIGARHTLWDTLVKLRSGASVHSLYNE